MTPTLESFLDSLARSGADEGIPPAAGRMLGWLLLREGPSSLDEVAEGLQVSKSAASDHGRLLARLGVAEVRRRPGDRRDYYEASEQLCERLLENFLLRLDALGSHLAEGERVAGVPGRATARLARAVTTNARITQGLRALVASHPGEAPPSAG